MCKTCSYEALSNNHEWNRRSSTDALNNNLRPKSEFSDGSTSSLNKNRKVPVTDIYLNDPFEVGGDGKLHLLISLFYMEFLNNLKKEMMYNVPIHVYSRYQTKNSTTTDCILLKNHSHDMIPKKKSTQNIALVLNGQTKIQVKFSSPLVYDCKVHHGA